MTDIETFAVGAMSLEGASVSLDRDDRRAAVECREHADETIDTGAVHDLAREHDVHVERVIGDFAQGILTVLVTDSVDDSGSASESGGEGL